VVLNPPAPVPPPVQPTQVPVLPDRRLVPRLSPSTVSPGPRGIQLSHGSTFLVCDHDGAIRSRDGSSSGLYSDDTRFVSRHEIFLNDRPLLCLAASRVSFRHARWTYTAVALPSPEARDVGGRVTVTLDRVVGARRLREEYTVRAYGRVPPTMLQLQLECDFADLFEVRTQRWQRRARVNTTWTAGRRLETRYQRDDFVRRCLVRIVPPGRPATYANGTLRFPVEPSGSREWRVCLQYDLVTSARARPALEPRRRPGGELADRAEQLRALWHRTVARASSSDLRLRLAFDRAVEDFAALRLYDHDFSRDVWVPAAGIPWFVAVFGRDSIIASLQALPAHPLFAIGTLQKLAQWQASALDPERDAEPGKICHEMRVGEWAHFHTIPHSPYYGTADATPLYLLLLGQAYRWLGDPGLLHRFRHTAERCLEWIDRCGDRDADGLQEYAPLTPAGYRNQCWRDAADGVLDEEGGLPPHPIATCELQAYVYAAKLSVADLFAAWGDGGRAAALRREAARLRRTFSERFWLADEGTIAFALDGQKRQVTTPTSNPGHCLWLGILDPQQAQAAADRLMRPDLFSGYGLRTLSSDHPSYDPHSYQRGSVWPHDTVIAAAGMRRCGRDQDAWRLIDGILAAASALEGYQLPELFAGLQRGHLDTPVPYEQANVPQAWAAGSVFHAIRILLGLEPDVPSGRIYLDPALPPWCSELVLDNLRVGGQRLKISARRRSDGSCEAEVSGHLGPLEVVLGPPPWWGDGRA
jgi:glycogen debranching enzyme